MSASGLQQTSFSQYFTNSPSDITLLFITNDNSVSLTNLKTSIQNSNAVQFPYGKFQQPIELISSVSGKYDNVIVVGALAVTGASHMEVDQVLTQVNSGKLQNSKNLIVVDLLSFDDEVSNNIIGQLSTAVANQNSISLLFEVAGQTQTISFPKANKQYFPAKEYGQTSPYPTRWPAYIIEGVLVGLMLAFIAVVGVYWTCQLQSPQDFETKQKARGDRKSVV